MKMKEMFDRLVDNERLLYKMAFVLIISIVSFSAYLYTNEVFLSIRIFIVLGMVIGVLYTKHEPEQEKISLTIETMTGVDTARFEMKRTELRIKAAMDNDGSLIKELTIEEWIENYN